MGTTGTDADDVLLSQFGYKEELRRTMGSYSSFALAFSMISVTTTVFTLFAQPFQTIGGIAIWLWLPVIAGVLLLAAVYGHLAVRLPITGYAYHWASRLVNVSYGWFTGYNACLCTLIGSAGISIALGSVFAPDFWANPTHGDVILLASLGVAAAVLINMTSMALTARINNIGASAELIGTLGLTVILAVGLFFFTPIQGPHVLVQTGSSTGAPVTLTAIATALLLPVWTLAGWEGSADLAEETHDPRRVAPRAMMRSVLVSGGAGLLVFAVFAMAIPGNAFNKIINSTDQNPVIAIFGAHFGSLGSDLLQLVAFVAVFSCLLANVTVATRTTYALARDNMLPLSRRLAYVSPRSHTPVVAVCLVGIIAVGVNFLSSGIATQVTGMISVVLYITYGATLVSALIGHRRNRIPEAPATYFSVGRALAPLCIIGIVWSLIIIACMTLPAASHTVGYYMIGFEIAGLLWFLLVLRGRLNAGTAGPRTTVPSSAASGPRDAAINLA